MNIIKKIIILLFLLVVVNYILKDKLFTKIKNVIKKLFNYSELDTEKNNKIENNNISDKTNIKLSTNNSNINHNKNKIDDQNNDILKKISIFLEKNNTNISLPINISKTVECDDNDYTNIIKFIKNKFKINNCKIISPIVYCNNQLNKKSIYEIKKFKIFMELPYEKNKYKCICDLSIIFLPVNESEIFTNNFIFSRKFGSFKILNIKLITIDNNLNFNDKINDNNIVNNKVIDNKINLDVNKNNKLESVIEDSNKSINNFIKNKILLDNQIYAPDSEIITTESMIDHDIALL